jgi:hypothetical protein
MDLLDKKVKVKRKGAVHRRRVTVDSAELPRRTSSFTTADKQASNLSVEAVGLEPAEVVEKRSKVASIKSMFLERRKTNLGFSSALLPEKVDLVLFLAHQISGSQHSVVGGSLNRIEYGLDTHLVL